VLIIYQSSITTILHDMDLCRACLHFYISGLVSLPCGTTQRQKAAECQAGSSLNYRKLHCTCNSLVAADRQVAPLCSLVSHVRPRALTTRLLWSNVLLSLNADGRNRFTITTVYPTPSPGPRTGGTRVGRHVVPALARFGLFQGTRAQPWSNSSSHGQGGRSWHCEGGPQQGVPSPVS
jgi:hypothetical protein